MSIELKNSDDPLAGYEVECPHCKQDFGIEGPRPDYCPYCGEELEDKP
jgi:rRNA maturation endonuclease Nob1